MTDAHTLAKISNLQDGRLRFRVNPSVIAKAFLSDARQP